MGIQSRIEASAPSFTPAMRRIADALRQNPAIVREMTISALAASCDTSVASVVRFCRAIGLSGYAELRMALATELGKEAAQFGATLTLGAEIAQSDSLKEMAAKVASLEMLAIEETVAALDFRALGRIVTALDKAQRILLFGIGASQFVAQDLHHKLFRIGRNAFLMSDAHEAWSAALLSPKGTVAIGFSHSGATADTVQFLDLARESGALTVAVTSVEESALAIQRYLQTRRDFDAPSDLVVLFNEMDAVVILGGTVRDEATREAMVRAAGNIFGVERVDDRMVSAPPARWRA